MTAMNMPLPWKRRTIETELVVKLDEEEAEVVVRDVQCTDTTDDNNDYEYNIAMEEENYCKDKTELVVKPT